MRDLIYDMIRKVVEDDVLEATGGSIKCMDVDTFDTVLNRLREDVPIGQVTVSGEELNDVKKLLSFLQEESLAYYHLKEKEFDSIAKLYMQQTGGLMSDGDKALCDNGMREVERIVLLNIIDRNWPDQIDNMDKLRKVFHYRHMPSATLLHNISCLDVKCSKKWQNISGMIRYHL